MRVMHLLYICLILANNTTDTARPSAWNTRPFAPEDWEWSVSAVTCGTSAHNTRCSHCTKQCSGNYTYWCNIPASVSSSCKYVLNKCWVSCYHAWHCGICIILKIVSIRVSKVGMYCLFSSHYFKEFTAVALFLVLFVLIHYSLISCYKHLAPNVLNVDLYICFSVYEALRSCWILLYTTLINSRSNYIVTVCAYKKFQFF